MAQVVSMKQLLESGVHFGHHTRRWNPRMGPYIFGVRNQLHIIDVTNPAGPWLISAHVPPTITTSFVVSGTYAYLTEHDGLHILDVGDSRMPIEIGFHAAPFASGVDVRGHFVYMAANSELRIVDVSEPIAPIPVGATSIYGIADLVVNGEYVYGVATVYGYLEEHVELSVVNVAQPIKPFVSSTTRLQYGDGRRVESASQRS